MTHPTFILLMLVVNPINYDLLNSAEVGVFTSENSCGLIGQALEDTWKNGDHRFLCIKKKNP